MMRKNAIYRLGLFLLLMIFCLPVFSQGFFQKTDFFLRQNVSNGQVDYFSIKTDNKMLMDLVGYVENIEIKEKDEKAFLINAYNLSVIRKVTESYPVKSVQDISGFFDKKDVIIAQKKMSLNDLEKKIFKISKSDPRLHFVLVCGAKGCPQIRKGAFFPDSLENQLEEHAKNIINSSYFVEVNHVEKSLKCSKLFKWYASDFGDLIVFINKYSNKEVLQNDYSIAYSEYDWSLNDLKEIPNEFSLQSFASSRLLTAGKIEVKAFNNLYTQNHFFDLNSTKIDQEDRWTFNTILADVTYAPSSKINVGLSTWIRAVKKDTSTASPLGVFSKSNENRRIALAYLGPTIKYAPFKKHKNISIQNLLLFPIAKNLEGQNIGKVYTADDRMILWNRIFYDKYINKKESLQFFVELGTYWSFQSDLDTEKMTLAIPSKAFINYFAHKKITLYSNLGVWPTIGGEIINSYFIEGGLGMKFHFTKSFELELLHSQFLKGKNNGAGATYNLGVRWLY